MDRDSALKRLSSLEGTDLRQLADKFSVTVWKDGKKNKGWAGHVVERFLGLPLNSSRQPDFGSWELKVVPLKHLKNGLLKVKETMAITMINEEEVLNNPFETSHLFTKLRRAVVVSRIWENQQETRSLCFKSVPFDLNEPSVYSQVAQDYELVRRTIKNDGFQALTGKMGTLVQPRTKGQANTTTRAFYARSQFVGKILGI
jgi:DNA mismatch repair protein MutH